MSQNKLVSIKHAIIDAIDQLGLDHHHDIPVFTRWASQGEKKIGGSESVLKRQWKVLDIVNCHAKLPEDARYVQMAIIGDLGCDCENLFYSTCGILSTTTFSTNAGNGIYVVDVSSDYTTVLGSVPHVIQDNKIILNNNYDGQKITIQYLGYERDEEGFLKIGENHVDAIKWYIVWLYLVRKRDLNSLEYGKMNMAKLEWNMQASNARATDNQITDSEREEIAQMLYDPLSGRGMAVGNLYEY